VILQHNALHSLHHCHQFFRHHSLVFQDPNPGHLRRRRFGTHNLALQVMFFTLNCTSFAADLAGTSRLHHHSRVRSAPI